MNDILMCSVSPELASFAHLTAEQALAKSSSGVSRIANSPDLTLNSPVAPEFCKRAQLIVSPENKIVAFVVQASLEDSLEVNEVLQWAEQFDFASGRDADSDEVYFGAQSKDKKILIKFAVQGRKSVLSWVRYSY